MAATEVVLAVGSGSGWRRRWWCSVADLVVVVMVYFGWIRWWLVCGGQIRW
ncbi:hypothetical protein Hanom_Chr09g00842061 [Helianthus anomalus]